MSVVGNPITLGGSGLNIPGLEISTITMTSDKNTLTVPHGFGHVPNYALAIASTPGAWSEQTGDDRIFCETLACSPSDQIFDITRANNEKINSTSSWSATGTVNTTNTYTTYPASMTANDITFATGRYYGGKFKAGVTYLIVIAG